MFFTVEALLLSKNLSFSSHSGVITLFGEHFVKAGIFPLEMGREINRAYQKRQLNDYEYNFAITQEEAETCNYSAGVILSEVRAKNLYETCKTDANWRCMKIFRRFASQNDTSAE
jgi:uncharacterized protein (UPF0332 family)